MMEILKSSTFLIILHVILNTIFVVFIIKNTLKLKKIHKCYQKKSLTCWHIFTLFLYIIYLVQLHDNGPKNSWISLIICILPALKISEEIREYIHSEN